MCRELMQSYMIKYVDPREVLSGSKRAGDLTQPDQGKARVNALQ